VELKQALALIFGAKRSGDDDTCFELAKKYHLMPDPLGRIPHPGGWGTHPVWSRRQIERKRAEFDALLALPPRRWAKATSRRGSRRVAAGHSGNWTA
jgi:hypothetical protein